MTATPIIKLGFRLPRGTAFSMNQAALGPLVPPIPAIAEQEAAGHWLFGSDYDSGSNFPDLISGQLLTKTGSVTINTNDVSLGVGANFLTTPIADGALQTLCCVVQQQALPSTPGSGALIVGADSGSTSGSALYNTDGGAGGGGYYAYTRGFNPVNQLLPLPSVTSNWIFLGVSHAPQRGPIPPTRTCYTSGGFTSTQAGTKTAWAGHDIQLGSIQISAEGALVAAELIVFNKYLTAAQLAAVYARSQARMSARGITVV